MAAKLKPDADLAAWCQALASVATVAPDVVPPGWRTAMQLAKEQGVHRNEVLRRLRRLSAQGLVESKKYRTAADSGRMLATLHYRLK
jgi:hypothetical protein